MISIIIGSASQLKIEAAREAAIALGFRADVRGIEADSRVAPQPHGLQETENGALARAIAAHDAAPEAYAVGIENGLVPEDGIVSDIACVALLTPRIDLIKVRSRGVRVPPELMRECKRVGWKKTAGSLEAERSGSDPADPHRVWSGGETDRKRLLIEALKEALIAATRTEGDA